MQRRRGRAGRVGEPLGGAARGRRQRDVHALLLQDRHDAAHDGRLADARAAGDHRDLRRQRRGHRLDLLARQRDARLALVPGDRALAIDLGPGRGRRHQLAQPGGQRALGPVQARLVDGGGARVLDHGRVDGAVAGARQPVDRLVHAVLGQVQQRGRRLRQPRARDEHVAVAALFVQHVTDAGLGARGRVARHAQRRRELVRRQEADPPHVEREPVRVLAHARDRRGAVTLVDARRERGRHAVALQEHHHLAHLALRAPRLADGARARRADAGDLADARRIAVQDLQRLDAEALDDARRELGPDPLDQPRAEIAAHAVDGLRRHLGVALDAELLAEPRRRLEATADAQHGARRDADQAADDGDDGAALVDLEPRHRERAVAARIHDALDRAFDRGVGLRLFAFSWRARPVEQIHARSLRCSARDFV
jgi:hypothetical protein